MAAALSLVEAGQEVMRCAVIAGCRNVLLLLNEKETLLIAVGFSALQKMAREEGRSGQLEVFCLFMISNGASFCQRFLCRASSFTKI